jgi:hypothetical protein
MRASTVFLCLGILLCITSRTLSFSIAAASGNLGGFTPPPLKRQGASRELLPSTASLYWQGKKASEDARHAIADTFTRTESVPHTEAQLLAKDRWAGIRNVVRNHGQFKFPDQATHKKISINDQYDMIMGGMSKEKIAALQYERARMEELSNDIDQWKKLGGAEDPI